MNKDNKIFPITAVLLILSGLFLRFYNLRFNTQFTWDQENSLAFPAREIIVNHHIPLIGAKTGVGDLYLTPFYSYLVAIFFFIFNMDPIAGAVLAGLISIMTVFLGFILVKKLFNLSVALNFALIWSTSTLIVTLDRVPWNVNLLPISSLLIFIGLWSLISEKKPFGWLYIGIGLFLGTSSHFSVIFLAAVVFVLTLLNKEILNRYLSFTILLLVFALLPLVFFDIRHGFLLSQNLAKFVSVSVTDFNHIFFHSIKISSIILETIGRIIFYDGASWIQQVVGLFFLLFLFILRNDEEISRFGRIFLIYLFIYLLGFTFYSGSIPEYYFTGLFSIVVIGFSLLFSKLEQRFYQFPLLIITLYLIVLTRSFLLVRKVSSQSLGVKQEIVKKIKQQSKEKPVYIVYDMELGARFGYDYLFDFYQVKIEDRRNKKNTFWISFPKKRFPGKPDFVISDIALGYHDTSTWIYSSKEKQLYNGLFKLRIPKQWSVIQCPDIDYDKYVLSFSSSVSCSTYQQEARGLLVINIPFCDIDRIEKKIDLRKTEKLPFFQIAGEDFLEIYPEKVAISMLITSFEKNRCIGVTNFSQDPDWFLKKELRQILNSIR